MKNYMVKGLERYNKTKIPFIDSADMFISYSYVNNTERYRDPSILLLEQALYEFDNQLRHKFYKETKRHVCS